ncbi:MAG: 4-hydroxythreonine-4-phosphate dehydrogenase PdxA [Flavobacteriaceae bacterium]|nr:4-hydroxythreonine-4-phosphate dehydrogenase PdxA [Flavobacteriaceae bacterium]
MALQRKIIIGISIGDPNGIGIEVILKTFEDKKMYDFFTPIVFGSLKIMSFQKKHFNLNTEISILKDIKKPKPNQLNIINVLDQDYKVKFGKASKKAGEISLKSLEASTKALIQNNISALVTAPINKFNIQTERFNYNGHTEYFNDKLEGDSLMLMVSRKFKVGLLTEHINIKEINSYFSSSLIEKKVRIIEESLKKDFGISSPSIAVLSLNPHVGDNGIIGDQDKQILIPTIKKINKKRVLAFGPYSADSFFGTKKYLEFDAVLAIYHDQGLIPFKLVSFGKGVNFTAGLNKIRTSPDHGTGYDIAGKGIANKESFIEALLLARKILIRRSKKRI